MVLFLTKNLILPGICKLQPQFVGPFQETFSGPSTYCLDLLPSMAAFRAWFHTNPLKPARHQYAGPPALADDSFEVKAILQIEKHGTHAKVKWVGYDSSYNQWIWLCELPDTALKVVKTFLRGEEQERVSL